jgi:HYR domain-containing protein
MNASGAAVSLNPTVADNCPGLTAACVPPSGSTFGFGTTPVTCTGTDGSGNTSMCSSSVTVTDLAPVIASVVASPNVLRPPNKKLDPVKILVSDSSACGLITTRQITSVTSNSGPLVLGTDYVITGPLSLKLKAAGNGGHAQTYIVGVTCTDTQNGSTTAQRRCRRRSNETVLNQLLCSLPLSRSRERGTGRHHTRLCSPRRLPLRALPTAKK